MSKKVIDGNVEPVGYQQITDVSSSVALTVATDADIALIQAQDQDVRWRDDGVAPTTTVGMILQSGLDIWYTGDLTALLFIETVASAKLNISYYNI